MKPSGAGISFANFDRLTAGERFIAEWQYDVAGHFSRALAECMALADDSNLRRLRCVFPAEAEAMNAYKNVPGWWDRVQDLLRSAA